MQRRTSAGRFVSFPTSRGGAPNKRVQPTSGVAYRMEYRGQRVPLKRQNVRNTVSLDLPRLTPTQERV